MIEVKKAENESGLNLLRRFNRRIQQSGVLKRARSLKFNARPESALKKKEKALKKRRSEKRMEHLWKLGKIEKRRNE
ncbi:MAG: 30S ribosomal protein S21 [Patescibacteria group bacterium]|nr:30S ribosomal protein S21 [Patescibacteria group bacterium]